MTEKRTTKSIASRIQLDYLKRFQVLKYWKSLVILSCLFLTTTWIFLELSPGRKKAYTPGPISNGHKLFEKNCSECHIKSFDVVPNEACLKCHSDLDHHVDQQTHVPRCTECHVEHQGHTLVETVSSANCAACHSHLERKDGQKISYDTSISKLDKGHPDFRFLSNANWPQTAIKLNHKIHMKADLEKADGTKTTLQCRDCHTVDVKNDPKGNYRNADLSYETQCRSCHLLGFDRQFPTIVAPHKKPEEVRAFLTNFYKDQLQKNPLIIHPAESRKLPGPLGEKIENLSGPHWVSSKISAAEKDLLGRTCLECHVWKYESGQLPIVTPVKIPKTALKLGRFDHAAHRGMTCAECHTRALTSEKTSDQLIPGVQTCITCHTQNGLGRESCFECHRYHSEGLEKF